MPDGPIEPTEPQYDPLLDQPCGSGLSTILRENELLDQRAVQRIQENLNRTNQIVPPITTCQFIGFRFHEDGNLYMMFVDFDAVYAIPIELTELHKIIGLAADILKGLPTEERVLNWDDVNTLH
jgi:hypothetical protein